MTESQEQVEAFLRHVESQCNVHVPWAVKCFPSNGKIFVHGEYIHVPAESYELLAGDTIRSLTLHKARLEPELFKQLAKINTLQDLNLESSHPYQGISVLRTVQLLRLWTSISPDEVRIVATELPEMPQLKTIAITEHVPGSGCRASIIGDGQQADEVEQQAEQDPLYKLGCQRFTAVREYCAYLRWRLRQVGR